MTFIEKPVEVDDLRTAIRRATLADETSQVEDLIELARLPDQAANRVARRATRLVENVRAAGRHHGSLDALLYEYSLTNPEGVVLMCLAEAPLRIPDGATADRLIRGKMSAAAWQDHLGNSGRS